MESSESKSRAAPNGSYHGLRERMRIRVCTGTEFQNGTAWVGGRALAAVLNSFGNAEGNGERRRGTASAEERIAIQGENGSGSRQTVALKTRQLKTQMLLKRSVSRWPESIHLIEFSTEGRRGHKRAVVDRAARALLDAQSTVVRAPKRRRKRKRRARPR